MVRQKPLACFKRRAITDQNTVHRMLLHARQGLVGNTLGAQRGRHRCEALQLYRVTCLYRRVQRGRPVGFHRQHRDIVPAVAPEPFDHATEQAAAAHRQHHRIGLVPGCRNFIHQAGMPGPQQRVIEGVNKGIVRPDQGLRQRVGLLPRAAMHHHLGTLLVQQILGAFGGGLRHYHRDRHTQLAPGVGYRQAGIATGRGHEVAGAPGMVHFAGMAHPAQLERATGLKRVELQPDRAASGQ
ncbi:hypothetical protein D3C79_767430 [compost metagenome]